MSVRPKEGLALELAPVALESVVLVSFGVDSLILKLDFSHVTQIENLA